jgi:N-acetylglucosamine malate deacetylase 1
MVDILAFGAHPDDIELSCGGLLCKAVAEGQTVAFCDLTVGEKGTAGNPTIRREEAMAAARLLGVERTILNFPDCGVVDSYEGRLELVKVIRHYRPMLVLVPRPSGYVTHPDHLACGTMARFACRYARFAKILPELPIHRPAGILHMPMAQEVPDFIIDVSPYVEQWRALVDCHASQVAAFPHLGRWMTNAQNLGRLIGVDYAQGLVKENPVVVTDLLAIARGTLEL